MNYRMNLEQLYSEISNGDPEAFDFIIKWNLHINRVDDIVDLPSGAEEILKAFVEAQNLIIHPFFIKNHNTLYPILVLAANGYADSCNLASSVKEDDLKLSDVLRSYGNEMLIMVAGICSAETENVWDRIRKYSKIIRQVSWKTHHDQEGKPI